MLNHLFTLQVKRTGGLNGKRKRRKAPSSSIKDTRACDAEVPLEVERNMGEEQVILYCGISMVFYIDSYVEAWNSHP